MVWREQCLEGTCAGAHAILLAHKVCYVPPAHRARRACKHHPLITAVL